MSVEIHPTAIIGDDVEIGDGCVIGPYVVIESGVVLGRDNEVGASSYIHGSVSMGDRNRLMRAASLGGEPQSLGYKGEETKLIIGNDNWFGENLTVHRGSAATGKTIIGDNNYLMAGTHVGHDCRLGNRVIMANDSKLGGHVTVKDGANFGAGAGVHQFARVGELVMAGAMTKVLRDVVPFTVVGQDDALFGLNRIGIKRSDYSQEELDPLNTAYRMFCVKRQPLKAVQEWLREQPASPFLDAWISFLSDKSIRGYSRALVAGVSDVDSAKKKRRSAR